MAITPEQARVAFAEGKRVRDFWIEHREALLVRYPDQFVAAKDDDVIAADADLIALLRSLEAMGLTTSDVMIEWLSTKTDILLL